MIEIPRRLRCSVEEDDDPSRHAQLATLPDQVAELAARWSLVLGEPLLSGGQCAWVAPARDRAGHAVLLCTDLHAENVLAAKDVLAAEREP